jgi:hypothetical protein
MFCSAVQVAAVDLYLDVRSQIEGQTKVRNKGKSFVLCDLYLESSSYLENCTRKIGCLLPSPFSVILKLTNLGSGVVNTLLQNCFIP